MSGKYPGGFVTLGAPAGYSVAFDGTGDYLSLTGGTNLAFGTGDFTIEFWVNITANGVFYDGRPLTTDGDYVTIAASDFPSSADNSVSFVQNGQKRIIGTAVIKDGLWHHVAVCKSSGTTRLFVDGVQTGGSYTDPNNYLNGASRPVIGSQGYTLATGVPTGFISNLRAIKGTALYTSTFTPPTQLFPRVNTQLLICQSPTIIDNSINAFTVTANDDAKVSNFTPFAGYTAGASGFNPALGSAASGVWTLDEATNYQGNRLWPIYDPYFNQTMLMLHGNGANTAQNNTFLDSSTNNFTITRSPASGPNAPSQGTFSPFSQTGWALNITAGSDNNDYISTPTSANLRLDQGNFTLEFWLFINAFGDTSNRIFDTGANADANTTVIGYGSDGAITWGRPTAGTGITSAAGAVTTNRWYHVVATSSGAGTNGALYINGARVAFTASYTNPTGTSSAFNIGKNNVNGAGWAGLVGYISNFRFVSGQQLYTSNFTPDVRPLTTNTYTLDGGVTYRPITGACQLLTCQDNRFVDKSANNFAITVNGTNPSVQAFSPFVPTVTTPTTYSNWFNGSTGYLTAPSNSAFAFGTGSFTWETWFYSTGTFASGDDCFYDLGSANTTGGFAVFITGGLLYVRINGTGQDLTYTLTSSWINTWHHLAVVRNGTTLTIYLDGISVASGTRAQDVTQSTPYIGNGAGVLGAYYFSGCLSNMRVVKGTALYTANFTPPTAPLTNISGTSLLTCQSSTLIDNSTANGGVGFTITQTGVVYPVASPTPFAPKVDQTTLNTSYSTSLIGGSGYFDGTGDSLSSATNFESSTSTSTFTIDGWVYPTTFSTLINVIGGMVVSSGDQKSIAAEVNTSGQVALYWFDGAIKRCTGNTVMQLNTWNYFAIVVTSNAIAIYVNKATADTLSGTTTLTNRTQLTTLGVGAYYNNNSPAQYFNGYLSSLRYSTVARTIFVPTTPFVSDGNTRWLLNFTNAGIIDNTAKNVLETVGNAQISTAQSKYGGSSMAFDGTGDYLQMRPVYLQTLQSAFTIESWIYPISTAQFRLWGNWNNNSNGYAVFISPTGSYIRMYYGNFGANEGWLQANVTIPTSTWSHVAVCRDVLNNWYFFLNGIRITNTSTGGTTWTNSRDFNNVTDPLFIGDSTYNGYIDDFRLTKNVARYVTAFTPPTSQLQDQ
jgi:hypothetical protein